MQVAALTGLLVGRHGFRGDNETYDDPRNANLMHVIDRRRGLPVALGILGISGRQAWPTLSASPSPRIFSFASPRGAALSFSIHSAAVGSSAPRTYAE